MFENKHRLLSLGSAVALGAALALQPLTLDLSSPSLHVADAEAKGGNGGNGNGGNGNGGNNGGGNAGASNGNPGNSGPAGRSNAKSDRGVDVGSRPAHAGRTDKIDDTVNKGAAASALGRLNAAHASPRALERANPRSAVGQIATYKAAFQDGTVNIEAAAQALAQAANKPLTISALQELNTRVGVSLDANTANLILARAIELQQDRR